MMALLNDWATDALREKSNSPTVTPLYIFDNVALQKKAAYKRIGYSRHAHVKTPPHSPDFNKPVEHIFNQIKRSLLERVNEDYDVELSPELAQEWVLDSFNNITTASIQADIKSLHDTWLIISTNDNTTCHTSKNEEVVGSGGDYISVPKYR